MVLGELFNGLVRVGPWHPVRGDLAWLSLVIDSRLSAVNPYSSRVRSTGPEGSLPFFRKNHGSYPTETRSWAGMTVALMRLGTSHSRTHPLL